MELPVTLIVKAPNHAECEDHTVKCELSWTIKRLKGHLSELYPCKPEEQKLIYSGQLLQDAVVLKDVLRQYDGQETHTVHLVYTPKQQYNTRSSMDSNKDGSTASPSSSSSSAVAGTAGNSNNMSSGDSPGVDASGLRRRNVASASTTSGDNSGPSPEQGTNGSGASPMNLQALYSQPFANASPMAANGHTSEQQIAAYQQWYQQQYLQYVNQYMAYMNTLQQQAQPQTPMHWPPGMLMQNFGPVQGISAATAAAASQPATAAGAPEAPLAADQQQQVAAVQQPPRFPMMVHEPDRPERDWLDHVNTGCRISFLLLMIYFYSSALRFVIVMCAILAVFLYRNRRALMNPERLPAVVPVIVPPQAPADGQVGAAAVDGGQDADVQGGAAAVVAEQVPLIPGGRPDNNNNIDLANRNAAAAAAAEATNGQEQNNPPTTVLSFLRTFVTSFFYSLLPEPAMAP